MRTRRISIAGALIYVALGGASLWAGPAAGPAPVECNDDVDNDRDGFTDFPEDPQCEDVDDNSEASGGEPTPTLTIRYVRERAFKGAIADSGEECEVQRRLVLRRWSRDGSRIIARTFTNSRARWKVYWPRAKGDYFAVAPETTVVDANGAEGVCRRVESVTIRVP